MTHMHDTNAAQNRKPSSDHFIKLCEYTAANLVAQLSDTDNFTCINLTTQEPLIANHIVALFIDITQTL